MKDYHCHILPGIDDGAQTLEDSLFLAKTLARWGFTDAVCTPHVAKRFPNKATTIREKHRLLKDELLRRGIKLNIDVAAEYRLNPETWYDAKREGLLAFDDNHVLIEFPVSRPEQMGDIRPMEEIDDLVKDGYIPVVAHPERYLYLPIEEIIEFTRHGALLQCNYGSQCGMYGDDVFQRFNALRQSDMVSFMGTDLHNEKYANAEKVLFE